MDNYCGIPDIGILWHGEWADSEIVFDGQTCNYYALDDGLWSVTRRSAGKTGKRLTLTVSRRG